MKTKIYTYGIIFGLLLGILESNGIPVLSVFGKTIQPTEQTDDNHAEDPVKESENLRAESVKPWLHHTIVFNFNEPVFLLPAMPQFNFTANSPYNFYPDVLTPPPNC